MDYIDEFLYIYIRVASFSIPIESIYILKIFLFSSLLFGTDKYAGRVTDRMLDFLINDGARGASDGGFIDASWDARLPVSRHTLAK